MAVRFRPGLFSLTEEFPVWSRIPRKTLGFVITSVKKVSDIAAEIAVASREQSSGIDQVNKAVGQMDEMTQQNTAGRGRDCSLPVAGDSVARVGARGLLARHKHGR